MTIFVLKNFTFSVKTTGFASATSFRCLLCDHRIQYDQQLALTLPKNVTGKYFTRGNCNKLLVKRCRYELRKNFWPTVRSRPMP